MIEMKKTTHSAPEFAAFEELTRRLLAVPTEEIRAKEEEFKDRAKPKKIKRNQPKPNPAV